MGPIGLYIHVPFCSAICNYCNFNRGLFDADLKTRYVAALLREITGAPAARADTIFFGGGTPSLLEPEEVARIVDACREVAGASGGLGRLLGLGTGISSDEESILEAIASTLRAR